jgi:type IV pilus assembly protein PilV
MASHAALNMAQSRQTGLSLLEVLIAIAILGIGVLGLAQMQAFGLLNVERAYQRSQATVLAYAIADKMRANVTTANSYLTEFMPAADASAQSDCKTTSGCTVAALAENDLFEWNEELTAELPGATGTIVLVDGNYTVAIVWDDSGDGVVDENDPSFEVSFAL